MNNFFNLNRFGRLLYKHTTEHYKSYLMSVIVLLGIMILGGGFLVYMVGIPIDENFQTILFMAMLLLSGTIFTSTAFADLGDNRRAIPWLTLPATQLEKYLVSWVYTVLIFLLVYTTIFYAVLLVFINARHFPGQTPRVFNLFQMPVGELFLLYAFLHGISFWGAIFFKRLHFIKTAFVFFICFALLVFFNKIVLGVLLGRTVEAAPPFGIPRIYEKGGFTDIVISRQYQFSFMIGVLIMMSIIFWVAAFYRLKEKEV